MIITLTDLESARLAAGRAMNEAQILKDLIDRHKTDPGRLRAAEGERYYKGDHDIKTHDFTTSTIYGEAEQLETFKNPNASDVRVPHKFLFNHIEQKVSYISGKEPSITVDGAKPNADGTGGNLEWQFQTALTDQTDARFRKVLLQWQRKASQHGVAWLHEYKDRDGKLRQVVIGRTEGIPIYDSLHEQDLIEFIRWYTIEVWTGTQNQTRIKAEWWTANDEIGRAHV